MKTSICKAEIEKTYSNVRNLSYNEKKSPLLTEEHINHFLDAILDLKSILNNKADKIYDINDKIEKLSWFNDLNDDCLMLINDLVSLAKDLRTTLIRQYIALNFLRKKGIAKDEIKNFKNAIDELKEVSQDIESTFFFLPRMPDFVETTKELSLI